MVGALCLKLRSNNALFIHPMQYASPNRARAMSKPSWRKGDIFFAVTHTGLAKAQLRCHETVDANSFYPKGENATRIRSGACLMVRLWFFIGFPVAISLPEIISDKYSCVGFNSCRAFTIPKKCPDILVSVRLY